MSSSVTQVLQRIHAQLQLTHPEVTTQERNRIIRARFEVGESQVQLARDFGISCQRVHQIVHGRHH